MTIQIKFKLPTPRGRFAFVESLDEVPNFETNTFTHIGLTNFYGNDASNTIGYSNITCAYWDTVAYPAQPTFSPTIQAHSPMQTNAPVENIPSMEEGLGLRDFKLLLALRFYANFNNFGIYIRNASSNYQIPLCGKALPEVVVASGSNPKYIIYEITIPRLVGTTVLGSSVFNYGGVDHNVEISYYDPGGISNLQTLRNVNAIGNFRPYDAVGSAFTSLTGTSTSTKVIDPENPSKFVYECRNKIRRTTEWALASFYVGNTTNTSNKPLKVTFNPPLVVPANKYLNFDFDIELDWELP